MILADKLTKKEALWLEQYLFEEITKKADKRTALYTKYHRIKRLGRYYRSDGAGHSNPYAHVHSIYMSWWEK